MTLHPRLRNRRALMRYVIAWLAAGAAVAAMVLRVPAMRLSCGRFVGSGPDSRR